MMIDTPAIGLVITLISGILLNASMKIPTNHSGQHRTKMHRLVTLILDQLPVSPVLLIRSFNIAHANLEGESGVWDGRKLPGV